MPRISQPTVAEHRAVRERALLDAAHAVLLETGQIPSLSAVAERAGLARTSTYQYFGSKEELLQAMVRDIYPRWVRRVTGAVAAAPTAADSVLAYAVANVELVAEGAHAVGAALAALGPSELVSQQAASMHRELQKPLIEAFVQLGVEHPRATAELVNALVHTATRQLEAGRDLEEVRKLLASVLGPMVRELGGHGM